MEIVVISDMSVQVDVVLKIDAVSLNFVFKIVMEIMIVYTPHVVVMDIVWMKLYVKEIKQ